VIAILLLSLFSELHWRPIGPIRGGRTKAAAGVVQRPGTFYIGAVNGGVFRTEDYGRTWTPIFDDQPSASIGAIAVAPSNPDIIYVGSGEGLQRPDLSTGDGFYKSLDAGKTWKHTGLRDGQQIPQIAVDPRDPSRLFVAVMGHPYGANQERGIFRSLDGGETFQKVLYKDMDTGGADVLIDPAEPQTVYAVLWESRQGPWENGEFHGPGSALYKSTDGGTTWKSIMKGLPDFEHDGLGRIGIGIALRTCLNHARTWVARCDGARAIGWTADHGGLVGDTPALESRLAIRGHVAALPFALAAAADREDCERECEGGGKPREKVHSLRLLAGSPATANVIRASSRVRSSTGARRPES